MSLADEVLTEHAAIECETLLCSNRPHGICRICAKFWPCESVRLATKLKAAEQVVEAARKVADVVPRPRRSAYARTWENLDTRLAEYDKEGQG